MLPDIDAPPYHDETTLILAAFSEFGLQPQSKRKAAASEVRIYPLAKIFMGWQPGGFGFLKTGGDINHIRFQKPYPRPAGGSSDRLWGRASDASFGIRNSGPALSSSEFSCS